MGKSVARDFLPGWRGKDLFDQVRCHTTPGHAQHWRQVELIPVTGSELPGSVLEWTDSRQVMVRQSASTAGTAIAEQMPHRGPAAGMFSSSNFDRIRDLLRSSSPSRRSPPRCYSRIASPKPFKIQRNRHRTRLNPYAGERCDRGMIQGRHASLYSDTDNSFFTGDGSTIAS